MYFALQDRRTNEVCALSMSGVVVPLISCMSLCSADVQALVELSAHTAVSPAAAVALTG